MPKKKHPVKLRCAQVDDPLGACRDFSPSYSSQALSSGAAVTGKLLDAAVDRLLILANKSVEEDLAIEQAKTQEQERSTVLTNGQTDLATFIP